MKLNKTKKRNMTGRKKGKIRTRKRQKTSKRKKIKRNMKINFKKKITDTVLRSLQKKENKKKKIRRVKDNRKYSDTDYPYRNHTKEEATLQFLRLRNAAEKPELSPKSLVGNVVVNYGTEKLRVKTKYRGKSNLERWNNEKSRKKMITFAKKLQQYDIDTKNVNPGVTTSLQRGISMQWATINTMRPAAAINIYKKYNAKRVLDFTAGWGARMIAAAAMDIDYIGIDANRNLEAGYNKILNVIKPHTKSKIKMIFKEAEKVNFAKLPKYDLIFTSPPYEYLEVYECMVNYEKTEKFKQPSSANCIKKDEASGFYNDFLIPTITNSFKHLKRGGYLCLNIPDIMYEKIKKLWKKADKKDLYVISKRIGSNIEKDSRRGAEYIYCWKKN
tara:strand:- start:1185 stop:2345 length:1161 start_codon:yes stop_codon:yes gene_type:complete